MVAWFFDSQKVKTSSDDLDAAGPSCFTTILPPASCDSSSRCALQISPTSRTIAGLASHLPRSISRTIACSGMPASGMPMAPSTMP